MTAHKIQTPRCLIPQSHERCFRILFTDGTKAFMYGEGIWWNGSRAKCYGVLTDFMKPIFDVVEVKGQED